jgi:hypothetical protein
MSFQKSEDELNKENHDFEETIHNILENINGLEQPKVKTLRKEEIITQDSNNNKRAQWLKHKKLQLWSNSPGSEYAIRLKGESNFLAATKESPLTQYTNLVEEADYLEDMRYNWGYTLKHWTSNRYHNDKDSSQDR